MPESTTTGLPDDERHVPTPWLRLGLVLGLLTFSGVTLAANVMPVRDSVHDTRKMLDEQERDNRACREQIEALRDEERALRQDPWVVNRVLREEFHRTDEGEITVR